MSQPATSFALSKLRVLFDDPLFIRAARGLRPTPRAEQLAEPLRRVLDQIRNDVLQPPRFEPATTRRVVTLNMSDVGELVFLPRIRARLQSIAPGIAIHTVSTPPNLLEEALESGEVDLAVGYFPQLQGAAVYQQRLFGHSFVCVVRRNHPSIGDKLTMQQFLRGDHAVVRPEGKSRVDSFDHALASRGLSRRIVLDIPHYLALPLIIADSDLIATVPYAVGLSFVRMADLKVLRPPIDVDPVDVKQHWHARFHRDPANVWLRGVVAGLFMESSRSGSDRAKRRAG